MKIETLLDLFTLKVMALYDIETQLVKALPKMAKAASDEDLSASFSEHLEETKGHVVRLEEIFEVLDMKPKKSKVEAIAGLIADTEWCIKEDPSPELLDALLIASARYVEHYEMGGYLSAIAWAEELGLDDAAALLNETLEEEQASDEKLAEAQVLSAQKANGSGAKEE
jgi:ferritin-like metal-binding protein YciE